MTPMAKGCTLRLVGASVESLPHPLPRRNAQDPRSGAYRAQCPTSSASDPHDRIAGENITAARFGDHDPRWLLARQTAAMLETAPGDCGARLRPERRRRLHELATSLGLRAFDANLVIAVVQDAAAHDSDPLSPACRSGLAMVGPARTHSPASSPRTNPVNPHHTAGGDAPDLLLHLGISAVLGLIGFSFLMLWVVGH